MNEILELLNGEGAALGLKGAVDRHERIFGTIAKVGVGVSIAIVTSALIFTVSTLAFASTANRLRAQMHDDSSAASATLRK